MKYSEREKILAQKDVELVGFTPSEERTLGLKPERNDFTVAILSHVDHHLSSSEMESLSDRDVIVNRVEGKENGILHLKFKTLWELNYQRFSEFAKKYGYIKKFAEPNDGGSRVEVWVRTKTVKGNEKYFPLNHHDGQLKLTTLVLQSMVIHYQPRYLYVGAAPGNKFAYKLMYASGFTWIYVDPRFSKYEKMNIGPVREAFFDDKIVDGCVYVPGEMLVYPEKIEEFNERRRIGRQLMYISDLRTDPTDLGVLQDLRTEIESIRHQKPWYTSLKVRFPYDRKYFDEYVKLLNEVNSLASLDRDAAYFYIEPFSPPNSTEIRLFLGDNARHSAVGSNPRYIDFKDAISRYGYVDDYLAHYNMNIRTFDDDLETYYGYLNRFISSLQNDRTKTFRRRRFLSDRKPRDLHAEGFMSEPVSESHPLEPQNPDENR
jgi:hypothetical protein